MFRPKRGVRRVVEVPNDDAVLDGGLVELAGDDGERPGRTTVVVKAQHRTGRPADHPRVVDRVLSGRS